MAMQGIYQVEGRNEIFVLEDDKWRYVCTEAVLFKAGYSWNDVQVIPVAEWCKYEVGYPMPGGWADPSNYGYFPHSAWYVEQCAVPPPPPPPPPLPPPPPPPNGDWTARQIQIPIIAWGGGIGSNPAQWPSQFKALWQTGCNIVGGMSHPVTDLNWWRQLAQAAAQYQIGIMPWGGAGMAGEADWGTGGEYYGERLRPEWEDWLTALGQEASLYGIYLWEEPNVFRQLYGEPTPESMAEQVEWVRRYAPEAKITGTLGLAEPQYAMNYPQTMDVVFPEWFVNPNLGTEYWTSQYHRLWEPMLSQFKGEVYPFILPSAIEKMSIEEILAGWEALQGPVTGLCYYGGLSNILQQVTAYNAFLTGYSPITAETLTHICGAKIQYRVSSVATHNVALACPYDGASLGVNGLSGSAVITNIDEMASKLQGEIATLDNKIAELQGRIETLRMQVAEAREALGV